MQTPKSRDGLRDDSRPYDIDSEYEQLTPEDREVGRAMIRDFMFLYPEISWRDEEGNPIKTEEIEALMEMDIEKLLPPNERQGVTGELNDDDGGVTERKRGRPRKEGKPETAAAAPDAMWEINVLPNTVSTPEISTSPSINVSTNSSVTIISSFESLDEWLLPTPPLSVNAIGEMRSTRERLSEYAGRKLEWIESATDAWTRE